MPITTLRIRPWLAAAQAAMLLLSASVAVAAGSRFTLVVEGKIAAVDASEGRVSVAAVTELAKARGAGLSWDAAGGVASIASGGEIEAPPKGFRSGPFTFVVDGKLVKSSAKIVGGVPFVPAKDLEAVAKAMGFATDLDAAGGVLAISGGKSGGGGADVAVAAPAATPPQRSWGINGTFMQSIAGGSQQAASAASGAGGDASVCSYMDSQKTLWDATEPTEDEKTTFKELADRFSEEKREHLQGNPADLRRFEATLKGFDKKVQRRLAGTKDSSPPSGADGWKSISVEFLENTEQVMTLALDLVRVMKEPQAQQQKEMDSFRKNVERIQQLQRENQTIGTQQVQTTVEVRASNGCAAP